MDSLQRDFKGIWISKEIWLDKRLSAVDKIVYAEIDSLDDGEGCFASNEYLAEFCQVSVPTLVRAIAKLKELGYISQIGFDGRTRYLQSNMRYVCDKADKSKRAGSLIKMIRQTNQNDKENNIDDKNRLLKDKSIKALKVKNKEISNNNLKEKDDDVIEKEKKSSSSSSSSIDNLKSNLDTFLEKFGIMLDDYGPNISEMNFELLTERFEESEWLKKNISSFKKVCELYPKIISGYYKEYNRKPKDNSYEMIKKMLEEAEAEEKSGEDKQGGTTQ